MGCHIHYIYSLMFLISRVESYYLYLTCLLWPNPSRLELVHGAVHGMRQASHQKIMLAREAMMLTWIWSKWRLISILAKVMLSSVFQAVCALVLSLAMLASRSADQCLHQCQVVSSAHNKHGWIQVLGQGPSFTGQQCWRWWEWPLFVFVWAYFFTPFPGFMPHPHSDGSCWSVDRCKEF